MLRNFWDKLFGRSPEQALAREAQREQQSPSERHVVGKSVDDVAADEFVGEHLGGVPADRIEGENEGL